MYGELEPLVLLPRFTTFLGAGDFDTAPLDLSAYSRIVVTVWSGRGTSFNAQFQDSHDAQEWFDLGAPVAGVNQSSIRRLDLRLRYLRIRVTTDYAVTCWAAGMAERRTE